jgi:cation transport regulator
MPYRTNSDLPPSVQAHLPPHAQAIYREAFNHAFAAHVGDPRQEEAAHRLAWGRSQAVLREDRRQLDCTRRPQLTFGIHY